MKKLFAFLWQYKLFTLAAITIIIGIILELMGLHTAAKWFVSIVALIELIPLLWGMWRDVSSGAVGIDILAATAIIASVWLGQYWAAIVIVVMLTGGETLEDYAEHRAKRELTSLCFGACAGYVIQYPLQFGSRKISVHQEPGFLADGGREALLAQGGTTGFGPAVLPNNRVVNGLSGSAVPHHRGFALVGDANRVNLLRRNARLD